MIWPRLDARASPAAGRGPAGDRLRRQSWLHTAFAWRGHPHDRSEDAVGVAAAIVPEEEVVLEQHGCKALFGESRRCGCAAQHSARDEEPATPHHRGLSWLLSPGGHRKVVMKSGHAWRVGLARHGVVPRGSRFGPDSVRMGSEVRPHERVEPCFFRGSLTRGHGSPRAGAKGRLDRARATGAADQGSQPDCPAAGRPPAPAARRRRSRSRAAISIAAPRASVAASSPAKARSSARCASRPGSTM